MMNPITTRILLIEDSEDDAFLLRAALERAFPALEFARVDNAADMRAALEREWDVVIDNARDQPEWVELSAHLLAPKVKQYIFTSTRSVYFDTSRVPMTVDAPVMTRENTPLRPGQVRAR